MTKVILKCVRCGAVSGKNDAARWLVTQVENQSASRRSGWFARHWMWLLALAIAFDAVTHGGILEPNWR